MKNKVKFIVTGILSLAFFSCSTVKEEAVLDTSPSSPSLMEAMSQIDFKHDYPVVTAGRAPMNAAHISFAQLIAPLDTQVMAARWPEVKKRMEAFWRDKEEGHSTSLLQHAALRYLREYFLLKNDQASLNETAFLLTILMDTGGVDLDVMADAFVAVRSRLVDSQAEAYERKLRELHDHDYADVQENWQNLYDMYLNADTEAERSKYLLRGRNMERRSKSCSYVRNLLGWELEGSK
jgi:hypothetical protein